MKYIHLFIASSVVEFAGERQELGNYIRGLNDLYVDRGIYFKLTICEDLSSAVELSGKQEFYNGKIREADFFYVIFGEKAGEYTLQEFDVALEQFRSTGSPRIYTYFRQLPPGVAASESILSFMSRLDREIGHYYSMFTHLDSIKLNMLLELTRCGQLEDPISFRDGQLCLGEDTVMSLENIPAYSRNRELARCRSELEELDREFARVAAVYAQNTSDPLLLTQMMELGQKRGKLMDLLRQMEQDLLELCSTVCRLKGESRPLNMWEREASRLLDQGDSDGALQILRDAQLYKELEQAKLVADSGIDRLRGVISAKRMLIRVLRSKGITTETVDELRQTYAECAQIAREYHLEMDCLYDYAGFLHDQSAFHEACGVIAELVAWYRYQPGEDEQVAKALMLSGILHHKTGQFREAEEAFLESLKLYEALYRTDSRHECSRANVYNSLGVLMTGMQRYEEALNYSLQAVAQFKSIMETRNTGENRDSWANATDTLSQIYHKLDRVEEALELYAQVHGVFRGLYEEDPERYLPRYAAACGQYAAHLESGAKKQGLIAEALKLFRKLAQTNPGQYLPKVVWILYLQAGDVFDRDREQAYSLYQEALDILMCLPEEDRDSHTVGVTQIWSNLAVLLEYRGENRAAEKMMLRVLKTREKQAQQYPEIYAIPLAEIHSNLMVFYKKVGNYEAAMRHGEIAKNMTDELVQKKQNLTSRELELWADVYFNLGNLLDKLGQTSAELLHLQACCLYGKLMELYGKSYERKYYVTMVESAKISYNHQENEDAEEQFRACYGYFLTQEDPGDSLSNACTYLMALLANRGEFPEAEKLLRQTLKVYEEKAKADFLRYAPCLAQTANNLAALLSRLANPGERVEDLITFYAKAAETFQGLCLLGVDSHINELVSICANLANAWQFKQDHAAAAAVWETLLSCLRTCRHRSPEKYEPAIAVSCYRLANILSNRLSQKEEAKALLLESLEIAEGYPNLGKLTQQVSMVLSKYFA